MEHDNNDELRARFTAFIKTVARNARIDYIRMNTPKFDCLPLEEWGNRPSIEFEDLYDSLRGHSADSFQFEEEELTQALNHLPLMRRRVLELLFIKEMAPVEIADAFHCSVQHIYNQKSAALKQLKTALNLMDGAYHAVP